jgi:hypothetical protein
VPSQCFDEVVELVRFPYGVHRIDDLVEAHDIIRAVIELGGAWARMCGHQLGMSDV